MPVFSYVLPAGALALALPGIKRRIELSRAKHRSLAGHSRMAKRLARWLPGYAYDEARFSTVLTFEQPTGPKAPASLQPTRPAP